MDESIPLKVEVRREAVYQEVWSEPIDIVAARYGVTMEMLRMACKRMGVPVPRQSHWAKVEAGKRPRKTPLPRLEEGMERVAHVSRKHARARRLTLPPKSAVHSLKKPSIGLPTEEGVSHPIVLRIAEDYAAATEDNLGRLKSRRRGAIPLPVSPELRERALRILGALMHALDERGHEVSVAATLVADTPLGPVPFGIQEELDKKEREPTPEERRRHERRIYHPSDTRPHLPPKYYETVLSGRLALVILVEERHEQRAKWADSERRKLEALLGAFVSGMLRYVEARKIALEERDARERRMVEERRRSVEASIRRQEEETRRRAFDEALDRWRRAGEIRRFADHVEEAYLVKHGNSPEGTDAGEWLRWAREYAAKVDPTEGLI